MRPNKQQYMMGVAHMTKRMSTCTRTQVGVVLTDLEHARLWIGYNGGPKGGVNACRHADKEGACGCVHAEANAVIKAPGEVPKVAYMTLSPCVTCAVMLINANVREVYYAEPYRDLEGIVVLNESLIPSYRLADDLTEVRHMSTLPPHPRAVRHSGVARVECKSCQTMMNEADFACPTCGWVKQELLA